MTFDCVLFDCSGSMAASIHEGYSNHPSYNPKKYAHGTTRVQIALDMLYDLHKDGKISGRTLIVPFDSVVRGGITMDLLLKMSRDEVMKLFKPAGGTNIADAYKYCGSINTLLITDAGNLDEFTLNRMQMPIIDLSGMV